MKTRLMILILLLYTLPLFAGNEKALDYQTYSNSNIQYEFKYPDKLLFPKTTDNKNKQIFFYKDKKVLLKVSSESNLTGINFKTNFQNVLDTYKDAQITFKVFKDGYFIISGYQHDKIFYQKEVLVSNQSNQGWLEFEMTFPKNEKDQWDPILIACVKSLKPLGDNPDSSLIGNTGNSFAPDYDLPFPREKTDFSGPDQLRPVKSLSVSLEAPLENVVLPIGVNGEGVTIKTTADQGFQTQFGLKFREDFRGRITEYQTAFFSPKKEFVLIVSCTHTPEFHAVGPNPEETSCSMALYENTILKWKLDDVFSDRELIFKDALVGNDGFVYLKTNAGFLMVNVDGKITMKKNGDSYLSPDKRYIAYSENSFIYWLSFPSWATTGNRVPPNDCSSINGISNFGSFMLCSAPSARSVGFKTLYEMLAHGAEVNWHVNTLMKPIEFVNPDYDGFGGGCFVFLDVDKKKYIYFDTQSGRLILTVSLPSSLFPGFEDYSINASALSYDGKLLAVKTIPRKVKGSQVWSPDKRLLNRHDDEINNREGKLFVFNILGEVLWTCDSVKGRIYFTPENTLVISSEKESVYSLLEKF